VRRGIAAAATVREFGLGSGGIERGKLTTQLQRMLGPHANVEVLCAIKQGTVG
jgi:hypothetical protein